MATKCISIKDGDLVERTLRRYTVAPGCVADLCDDCELVRVQCPEHSHLTHLEYITVTRQRARHDLAQ